MIQDFLVGHNFNIIQLLLVTIGYLMPIPLAMIALHLWHHYRQENFIVGMKWTLLEIQIPRDITKTPAAMELIFSNAFYQKTKKGFWEQFIEGQPLFWFSLEIVSINGRVHFFIRMPSRLRNLVETQIYGQYPQAKVIEVDDYAFHIPQYSKDGEWNVWGCEYTKAREDFLPIKTYKGFGDEMKTGIKEEFKVDPITPTIEYLGSLAQGQQLWIQIIVRPSIKTYHDHATGQHLEFHDAVEGFMKKLLKPYTAIRKDVNDQISSEDIRTPEIIKPVIAAVQAQMNQLHFDCGIRVIALSHKTLCTEEQFKNLFRDSRLIFRQYAQPRINELDRVNTTSSGGGWSDPKGNKGSILKNRMLDYYRLRTFFHPPIQHGKKYPIISLFFPATPPQIFVVSTEELATLYHFPGMVSETPSFKRLESKIAKPPANLPL